MAQRVEKVLAGGFPWLVALGGPGDGPWVWPLAVSALLGLGLEIVLLWRAGDPRAVLWLLMLVVPALPLMYGRETLEKAFALFNQDERFFGLTTLGSNFEGSAIHQRLLEAYRKVRA